MDYGFDVLFVDVSSLYEDFVRNMVFVYLDIFDVVIYVFIECW